MYSGYLPVGWERKDKRGAAASVNDAAALSLLADRRERGWRRWGQIQKFKLNVNINTTVTQR